MSTVIVLILLLLAAGILERGRAGRARRRLPVRIHVNGTRGKSSVTRLIAAGLRAGGQRVAAKTTGTAPRYIDPSGLESAIARPAGTAIREQAAILERAAGDGAEVLVVECMALQPETLSVSEDGFIRSSIGVITNVRADHLDLMGPSLADVARNLARTVPRRGRCFTAERDSALLAILRTACRDRGAVLETVPSPPRSSWAPGFGYIEHEENVALALAVCEALGVPPDTALAGMKAASPDPGAMCIHEIAGATGTLVFANGFAANDPDSTKRLWDRLQEQFPGFHRILVVTTRPDRVQRAAQFGAAIAGTLTADRVFVAGPLSGQVLAHARKTGASTAAITDLGEAGAEEIWRRIVAESGGRTLVFGCGNIAGTGQGLVEIALRHATSSRRPAA